MSGIVSKFTSLVSNSEDDDSSDSLVGYRLFFRAADENYGWHQLNEYEYYEEFHEDLPLDEPDAGIYHLFPITESNQLRESIWSTEITVDEVQQRQQTEELQRELELLVQQMKQNGRPSESTLLEEQMAEIEGVELPNRYNL